MSTAGSADGEGDWLILAIEHESRYDRTNPHPLRGQSETLVHYSLERGAASRRGC
jgi:hypothetical protein